MCILGHACDSDLQMIPHKHPVLQKSVELGLTHFYFDWGMVEHELHVIDLLLLFLFSFFFFFPSSFPSSFLAFSVFSVYYRFLDGPLFPMLFCLCGFLMLSIYLNPYWLQTKFRQVRVFLSYAIPLLCYIAMPRTLFLISIFFPLSLYL